MNEQTNSLHQVEIKDALPFSYGPTLGDNELVVIDKFEKVQLTHPALQTSFFTIAYCNHGTGSIRLNGKVREIEQGDLIVFFGKQIINDINMSSDFELSVLLQSRDFVHETLVGMLHLWAYALYLIENPIIHLPLHEQAQIVEDYRRLLHRLRDAQHKFRRESLKMILRGFYLDICSIIEHQAPRHPHTNTRIYHVFYQFMDLLSQHYTAEREVAWYAAQMQLTPKYLSEVVKQVSGRTVSQWVTMYVVMEIKSLLRNSDLSIKEIAEKMNFPTQSFLGKFFKNVTGISPLQFRKNGLA